MSRSTVDGHRPALHVVLPNDIDDPSSPSGGNIYDRQLCRGLATLGWSVREHAVRGAWPHPTAADRAGLTRVLAALPAGALVLVDGLVASAVPDVLTPAAERLRTAVLMHMPLGHDTPAARADEQVVLTAAEAVITTSTWTRGRLLELYPLPAERIHVATPGVDRARVVDGSPSGTQLLCVAAVTPHKGHDLLAEALAGLTDLPWSLECVGPLTRDPDFVDQLRKRTYDYGLADRMRFVGARSRRDVAARYARADLFVLASRGETYGMVVTEALARGIPVVATAGRGLPEAMGRAPDGSLPGILVEPDDPTALAAALRLWLGRTEVRRRLKRAAIARRATLTGWSGTAGTVSNVLDKVSTA